MSAPPTASPPPASAPRAAAAAPADAAATTTGEAAGQPSLGARTVRGSLISALGYGGGQVLRFGANLVLTRLLFPEAFGTMAIINALIVGLHLFSDVGIRPAIIQSQRGDEPAFLNTAWTIQVVRGFALFAVAGLLAYPAAAFYGEPALAWLIPAVATTTILDGLCSTKIATLHRHLALGRYTLIELGAQACASAVMIGWALVAPSLWALVGGTIAGQLARTVASHCLAGAPNRLHWDPQVGRELLGFGKWIFLSTMLTFVGQHCDRLVFGKITSLEVLGVYNIALMVALTPAQAISHLGASVCFPAFSRALAEQGDLAGSFRRARAALALGGGYLVAGMIAAGPPVVAFAFDARYAAAGWMVQLLALGAWFGVLETSTGAAILALGQVRWLAAANLAKAVGLLVLLPAGYAVGGFAGALVGLSLAAVAKYAVVAVAAGASGLPVLRRDGLMSAWVGVSAGVGLACSHFLASRGAPNALTAAGAGTAVTLLWAPYALARWHRRR